MNKTASHPNTTPSKLMNRFKKNAAAAPPPPSHHHETASAYHHTLPPDSSFYDNHNTNTTAFHSQPYSMPPTQDQSPFLSQTHTPQFDSPPPHWNHQSTSTSPPFQQQNGHHDTIPSTNGQSTPGEPAVAASELHRVAELEAELQITQTERDDLLRERKFWLAKIQTDNSKLMELLLV
jgi:hypothetical protein